MKRPRYRIVTRSGAKLTIRAESADVASYRARRQGFAVGSVTRIGRDADREQR